MGKLLVRKLTVAAVFAIIAPFIIALLLVSIAQPAISTNEQVTSLQQLLSLSGVGIWLIAVGIFTFLVSFISAQLVPARRRRHRNSGTTVESDVEDGRERGVVKWFNVKKGFGFITWDQGEDVFVHFRSIRGDGHRSLSEGQRVKFTVVSGEKGPQAEDVSAVR